MRCVVEDTQAVGVKVEDPEDDSGEGSSREIDRFFGKIGFLELIVRMGSHMNRF